MVRHALRSVCLSILTCLPAFAEIPAGWRAPRTPDGRPDLQGVWTNTSLTTLERPSQFSALIVAPAEAEALARRTAERTEAGRRPTDPSIGAPPAGRDVGGYNNFYIDSGSRLAMIDGQYRSSWVVEPADGRLPYTEQGRRIYQQDLARRRTTFDGPEIRPLGERCVVGFGSTAGPPMMNVLYNNTYQIVQTPEAVVILVEMNHDARIVRMNADPLPAPMSRWMGDSTGRWEGDTLVVETRNLHPQESLRTNTGITFYISRNARITERFTRTGPDEILYQFEVDDPEVFSSVWKAEMPFTRASGQVYEYACHEGNYSLPGILGGARADERRGIATVVEADGE